MRTGPEGEVGDVSAGQIGGERVRVFVLVPAGAREADLDQITLRHWAPAEFGVVSDLPHFTFLGRSEAELPALGLRRERLDGYDFWVPDL